MSTALRPLHNAQISFTAIRVVGKGWVPQSRFDLLGSRCYKPAIAIAIDSKRMDIYDINIDGCLWKKKVERQYPAALSIPVYEGF